MLRPLALLAVAALLACGGGELDAGSVQGPGRDASHVAARERARTRAEAALPSAGPGQRATRQILFGDLHVHTTYSVDAFLYALPLFGGEGSHPPADACDFARYCADLDFFSINDHAEGLTPERWRATIDSLRACDARAGDPASPDLVPLLGWEWTQVGATPQTHYGHKNVVLPTLDEQAIPTRPITSLDSSTLARRPPGWQLALGERAARLAGRSYADFVWWIRRLAALEDCPEGVAAPDLPDDCRENAATPEALFRKLDEWGLEALVIPHGLAWGAHAPPGARLDNQLDRAQHDPGRQLLLEIFSGHGNGEEYRRKLVGQPAPAAGEGAAAQCPAPSEDFLPCCWRAGEIIRSRCGDLPAEECEARVLEARRLALEAGIAAHRTVPGTSSEDWLDCDQCRDCFKPALSLRAGESAQYSLALSRPPAPDREDLGGEDPDEEPLRFRWGFIASTDSHKARPGTGYKQYERRRMTDSRGLSADGLGRLVAAWAADEGDDPGRARPAVHEARSFGALLDTERGASFMYPGGIVGVHSQGRDRQALWQALQRREVYGTSGPRILLWFDLLNGEAGRMPMGSQSRQAAAPRFEVRAVGAFVQQPGCPDEARRALGPERLESLCRGECYAPGDERHPIVAIEVVRVRPQREPDEPIADLIEDPWRRFDCPPDPAGCRVVFSDEDWTGSARDAVYYVRALQEETPAINADTLRTSFDEEGRALASQPCPVSTPDAFEDDCLAPARERAWSSPIFIDRPRPMGPAGNR